jgi:transketolase
VFVTRPSKEVPDRRSLRLAPAADAANGVYLLRPAHGPGHGTVVLQGSEVAYSFVQRALPRLDAAGINVDAYYVCSAELFGLLPRDEQARVLPEHSRATAMGITGFTLPTLLPWISSERGRLASLHPFKGGLFPGSGHADQVLLQAGLDGDSQFRHIERFVRGEAP